MNRLLINRTTISAIPVLCILFWYTYYRLFLHPSSSLPDPFDFYGTSIAIALAATFIFCVVFSNELPFGEFIRLSLPLAFIYYFVYAVLPSIEVLAYDFSYESLGFTFFAFFTFDIPLAVLLLFANSLAGWFGSLLHKILFKVSR